MYLHPYLNQLAGQQHALQHLLGYRIDKVIQRENIKSKGGVKTTIKVSRSRKESRRALAMTMNIQMNVNAILTAVIGVEITRRLRSRFSCKVERLEILLGPIVKFVNTGRNNISGYFNITLMNVLLHPVTIKILTIASSTLGTIPIDTNKRASCAKMRTSFSLSALKIANNTTTFDNNDNIVAVNAIKNRHVNTPPSKPLVLRIANGPFSRNLVIPKDADTTEMR